MEQELWETVADYEAELGRKDIEINDLKEQLEQMNRKLSDNYDKAMKSVIQYG